MPTVAGMRRRGFPPGAIREFCAQIGVAKKDNLIDVALLEHCVREELNETAPRAMAVLRPLRVVIDNYPEDAIEEFECANHPQRPDMGTRMLPFSRELYIERDDFQENPPGKYKRLAPGREIRLRNAYVIKYESMVKDDKTGEILELHCTYDSETRNAPPADGRKIKGVIHWLSARHSVPAEVRLYDHLFTKENPLEVKEGEDWLDNLNPNSLQVLTRCKIEPSLASAKPGERYQFERKGYFCVDPDSRAGKPVFNRTVTLRDTWAKIQKKQKYDHTTVLI